MTVATQYADFLEKLPWNYFITCRTPYKIHTMTVRKWVDRLFSRSHKVDYIFYSSERDKGDYNNYHVHMIMGTNSDMTYKEVRYGLGNISVGDYQPIYDSENVCKYIAKHVGQGNIDYDFILKP